MEANLIGVQQALEQLFSSGVHARSTVSDLTSLGSGYDADVYSFSLTGPGDSTREPQDLVLRVYARDGASENARREYAAMHRLHEAGYPVPRVVTIQNDGASFVRPAVIMQRIRGVSLGASFWSGSSERKQDAQTLLWRLIAQLHMLPAAVVLPDEPLAAPNDLYAAVDRELHALTRQISRLGGKVPNWIRDAIAWLTALRPSVPCARLSVLHGDFHPNNVLVRTDGAPFVIDWSNGRLGDPRSDVAWTRLITRANEQPDGGAAQLRHYAHLVGDEVTMIDYFDVAASVKLLLSALRSSVSDPTHQDARAGSDAQARRDSQHTRFVSYVAALFQKRAGIRVPTFEHAAPA